MNPGLSTEYLTCICGGVSVSGSLRCGMNSVLLCFFCVLRGILPYNIEYSRISEPPNY